MRATYDDASFLLGYYRRIDSTWMYNRTGLCSFIVDKMENPLSRRGWRTNVTYDSIEDIILFFSHKREDETKAV